MKEIAVVWVGRRAPAPWEEIAGEYRERLARMSRFSEFRLRAAQGRGSDPGRALAQEASAIAGVLRERDFVVALDERGRQFTSEALADWLGKDHGLTRIVFVLGSDLGLDRVVLQRARLRLSLSPMTLPHLLARVVLLEQLYRALDIEAGGAYHRAVPGSS